MCSHAIGYWGDGGKGICKSAQPPNFCFLNTDYGGQHHWRRTHLLGWSQCSNTLCAYVQASPSGHVFFCKAKGGATKRGSRKPPRQKHALSPPAYLASYSMNMLFKVRSAAQKCACAAQSSHKRLLTSNVGPTANLLVSLRIICKQQGKRAALPTLTAFTSGHNTALYWTVRGHLRRAVSPACPHGHRVHLWL